MLLISQKKLTIYIYNIINIDRKKLGRGDHVILINVIKYDYIQKEK
jgi:hypothetical protein